MSNQKATTTASVQAVTGPDLNKDYQLLLDRLLKLMREQMGECLLAVCLYGSLARGQAHQGSDVDLFIVVQGEREEAGKIKRAPAFYFEIDILPEEARRAARGAAEVLQLGLDLKARLLPGAEAEEESPSQRQGKE